MKKLHIFTVGKHTTAKGEEIEFTEADLQAIAANYDQQLHEAPLVIGHPKSDGPAYGWAKAVTFQEGDLFVDPDQVQPEFSEMVEGGQFKKISAAFYPPEAKRNPTPGSYYLRHVGFLGAQPPAIKGLKAVEFAEDDDLVTIEFGEEAAWSLRSIAELLRGMRDLFIEKFGKDEADKTIPSWQIDSLAESARRELDNTKDTAEPEFSEPSTEENTMDPKEELRKQQEKLDAEQAEFAEQKKAFQAQQQQNQRQQHVAFCESLVDQGKLLPANKEFAVEFMSGLSDEVAVEFGEGDGKQTTNQLESFKKFLTSMPNLIEFGEAAPPSLGDPPKKTDEIEFSEDLTARV